MAQQGGEPLLNFYELRDNLQQKAVRTFASFEAEPGHKFDKLYQVCSQRFYRDDLEGTDFVHELVHLRVPNHGKLCSSLVRSFTNGRLPSVAESRTTEHPIRPGHQRYG
jgi:hypothetical protein